MPTNKFEMGVPEPEEPMPDLHTEESGNKTTMPYGADVFTDTTIPTEGQELACIAADSRNDDEPIWDAPGRPMIDPADLQ